MRPYTIMFDLIFSWAADAVIRVESSALSLAPLSHDGRLQ